MTNVIVIKNEYPDDVTQIRNVAWETAGVYDVINTIIASHEIANKIKDEKDITELDIEQNIYGYFGRLIEEIKDEVMERLEHCEGCTCDKVNDKWVFNKTNQDTTKELIDKIIDDEDDNVIEFANIESKNINNHDMKPVGEFAYMIEFFSTFLINEEEEEYRGDFGHNGKYITDCFILMENTQRRAIEIEEKYSHLGVKVTLGDFNTGCQYGMATYVWVPLQE